MYLNEVFLKWFYFSILVVLFGSAFVLIELSLNSFSPTQIAFFRVFFASIFLLIYSVAQGYKFNFIYKYFNLLFILGLSGTTIPFFLISWAQQTISSSETGILIGFMPLFTVLGSHYLFKYEKLTANKILGFIVGFLGLLILLLNNNENINFFNNIYSKVAVIISAFFYALNALLVKKINDIEVIPLSAVVMIFSTVQLIFLSFFSDEIYLLESEIYIDALISIIILSILSTAFATVLYYKIIQNYGPNFLSLVNYPIPVFAFFAGIVFLKEQFNFYSILSLFLVIISIYISRK
tara:strand:- start:807 stop:1688 length:882 start_codon:yes stop_codon:yes gene_type:complete